MRYRTPSPPLLEQIRQLCRVALTYTLRLSLSTSTAITKTCQGKLAIVDKAWSFYLRRKKCHIFNIYSKKENMAIQMIGERQEKITFTLLIVV